MFLNGTVVAAALLLFESIFAGRTYIDSLTLSYASYDLCFTCTEFIWYLHLE